MAVRQGHVARRTDGQQWDQSRGCPSPQAPQVGVWGLSMEAPNEEPWRRPWDGQGCCHPPGPSPRQGSRWTEKSETKLGIRNVAKRCRGLTPQPCKVGLGANWEFRRAKPTGGLASRSRVLTWQRRQNLAEAPIRRLLCVGNCLRFVSALPFPSARDVDFFSTLGCPTTPGYKGWPEISVLLCLKSTSPLQISSSHSVFCIAAVKSVPFSKC